MQKGTIRTKQKHHRRYNQPVQTIRVRSPSRRGNHSQQIKHNQTVADWKIKRQIIKIHTYWSPEGKGFDNKLTIEKVKGNAVYWKWV